MRAETRIALIAIPATLALASLVAWVGSQHGRVWNGVHVFALCGAVSFVIQWIGFVIAYARQSEHFFDLTGSLTYLSLVGIALLLACDLGARALLLASLIGIWAARLGSFLFTRVRAAGFDRRFTRMKTIPAQFLMTWTLQGAWVFVGAAAALAAITAEQRVPLGLVGGLGVLLWAIGFGIEVVADRQKTAFRSDPANREDFIRTGLWAWSRHPNYFGEITLWFGIALLAFPALRGWQVVAGALSPLFVILLLTKISGVRMLEASADRRWADDANYQAYKARTPTLIPRPPREERLAS